MVQPTLCVSLAHDGDFWRGIKADFPDTFLIGRLFEIREGFSSDWRQVDPRRWAEECASLGMPYDAFITRNEPDGINNEVTADDARRYDDWCCQFRGRALQLGFEAVGPNVPAGNWHGDAVVRHLPNLCQSFKYISDHEYSARAMWDQQPALERAPEDVPRNEGESVGWWYTLRYRGWKRAIYERYPWREGQFQIVVSEGGVAYGVIPDAQGRPKYGDVGWRTDMTEDQYIESLDWYTRLLNEDDYCLGWAIFMVGAADPAWNSFETLPLWGRLVAIPEVPATPAPEPEPEEPEPEPEEGGGMEGIRVFKWDPDREVHVEQVSTADKEALVYGKYGAAFRRADVDPGQRVYRLVELWEKTGHSSLVTQVLNEDDSPMAKVDVALYWRDAPDPPDPPTEVYLYDWYDRFVHGLTNVNGDVGPGMGPGAYHGEGEGGPHAVWVRDPSIPSDIVDNLGMLAGTFHDHLDQKFGLRVAGSEPGNGGSAMFQQVSQAWTPGGTENYIRLVPLNHNLLEMYGNLRCGTWEIDDLVSPQETAGGVMIELNCTYPENEARTYEGYIVDHRTMETVGGPFLAGFEAGEHGCWTFEVEWTTGPTPTPPPTPPPASEDPRARLIEIADEIRAIADSLGVGAPSEVTLKWADGSAVSYRLGSAVASRLGRIYAALLGKQ